MCFIITLLCALFACAVSECPEGLCLQSQTCCPGIFPGSYGCCPMEYAVCCPDNTYCCPHGTDCDAASGSCVPQLDETVPLQFLSKRKGLPVPEADESSEATTAENAVNIRCDSHSEVYCPDGQTCCATPTGRWGCCPYDGAICCPDKQHCCPEGEQCDATSQYCISKETWRPSLIKELAMNEEE